MEDCRIEKWRVENMEQQMNIFMERKPTTKVIRMKCIKKKKTGTITLELKDNKIVECGVALSTPENSS